MDRLRQVWGLRRTGVRWLLLGLCGTMCSLTAAHAQGFFPRGDANCSLDFTAADAIAVSRAAGGTVCDNDDCTRDGVVDGADIDCGIACLFGACTTPPNAPEVAGIEVETGENLTPYATIHIIGNNMGSEDRLKRVTFNGVDAEVLEFLPPDELVVLVPAIAPGRVEMAVYDGDLIGQPTAIDIAAQVPIGEPDTFAGTLDLIDTALTRFATLPLDAAFGDDAILVGSALETFRDELGQQRAVLDADPNFTVALRTALDAAFDSSSVPDDLRDVIADIDAIEGGREGGAHQSVVMVANAAQKLNKTIKVARAVLGVGAAAATTLSAPAAIASILAGASAGVLTLAGSAALPPILIGVTFTNAAGQSVGGPTPGGFAVVRGRRLLGTNFVIATASGKFVVPPQIDGDNTRQFQLPGDTVGFCGRANTYLERSFPLAGRSAIVPDGVIPQLQAFVGPNPTVPFEELAMRALGVSGCDVGGAIFVDNANRQVAERFQVLRPQRAVVRVPNLAPGAYSVFLEVGGRRGEARAGLTVETGVNDVRVTCQPQVQPGRLESALLVAPGTPSAAMCTAETLPPEAQRPLYSSFEWLNSDAETVALSAGTSTDRQNVTAKLPGAANIRAVLKVDRRSLASSQFGWLFRVSDQTAPTVSLSSASPSEVTAGGVIPVRVRASDNVVVSRVRIVATGDPVVNGEQEFSCVNLQKTCNANFNVNVSESFDRNQVTIVAEAFDGSGQMATSSALNFTVHDDVDDTCPSVSISSPPDGGTVNAGTTTQVVARATDAVGVKRFRYSASGEALVTPVAQELPFPTALTSADLHFAFTVKDAADLDEFDNLAVTIVVEAFDEAGNTCGAQTATVSVVGVLDQCEGSITTDKPSGYVGEAFKIRVTITGDVANEITRVTSNNPGGQFDLTRVSTGVYEVTLFYQGRGRFTLAFIAFDAAENERCSGSIGLEALGDKPE